MNLQIEHQLALETLEEAVNRRLETVKVVERIKTEIVNVKEEDDGSVSVVLRDTFIQLQQHQRSGVYSEDEER